MIGQILDNKYELIRLLGEGGMGAVYEAKHTGTGRRVAIKVISIHLLLKKDAESVRRFHREAKATGAVESRHIAQVLDVGTEPATGAPYLAMEYLHGSDLEQLLARTGPLPVDVALRIVAQACMGLQKAHEAHVVHRDIKPANLFLAREQDGEIIIKIVDFGIAKIRSEEGQSAQASGLTRTGAMLGSPLYMSPEQARGTKDLDVRTDIWSLGVTLYRALSGRAPHAGIDGFGELIMALCSKAPPPIQDAAPWVCPEIARVIHHALRFDPEQRFPSAQAMLDAIKPLLPDGSTLHHEQLVGLTEDERKVVAPKLDVHSGSFADGEAPPRHIVRTSLANPSISETDATVSTSTQVRRARAPLGFGVALGAALGAAGIYAATTSRSTGPVQARTFAIAIPASPVPERSAPVLAPAVVPAGDPLRVKLGIVPDDAAVEVDGTSTGFKNGYAELVGSLGSVHRVRVFKGKSELVEDVVITADGAMPAKLQLKTGMKLVKPAQQSSGAVPLQTPAPRASSEVARPAPTADNPLVPDSFQ